MSMFRRPGDSSSDESTSNDGEEESTNALTEDLNLLSRINTLDSARSGRNSGRNSAHNSGRSTPLNGRSSLSRSTTNVRDILLHSLLEDKALREAAEHLGRRLSDPDVKELASMTYQTLSRQLGGPTDEHLASDQMRGHRVAAQQGLETVTRGHMSTIKEAEGDGQPNMLVARNAPIQSFAGQNSLFSHIPPAIDLPLQGYPGLHTDRYAREFVELDVIGKGGYGKVYKCQHKLDNAFYAVKRIMVSPARLKKIQDNGPQEMEALLEEVRALARFDHVNVARYYNCWLEFTTAPNDVPLPPTTMAQDDRLLEDAIPDIQFDLNDMSLGDPFANVSHSDHGIIFETSDATGGAEESEDEPEHFNDLLQTPKQRMRSDSQVSQATVATISSTRSHMSTIEDANSSDSDIDHKDLGHNDSKNNETENIQRHDPSTDLSQSMISNSDAASNQLILARSTAPILTLNVQTSLYDTNLASYLSTPSTSPASGPSPTPHHCFHPCVSLSLLSHIVSGVTYLHAQGIVHRDLKPANIFLALSRDKLPPLGSIDTLTCISCCPVHNQRQGLHITPRIGDFGLVAALGNDAMTSPTTSMKPVGTEFYRPVSGDKEINEKLDVYALGVVGFELLWPFATRMERVEALTQLRHGVFPAGFAAKMGGLGEEVRGLIKGMVEGDERERWGLQEVGMRLRELVCGMREGANRVGE